MQEDDISAPNVLTKAFHQRQMSKSKEKVLTSLQFVNAIQQHLLCIFCDQIAFGPWQIECGHLICDMCFEEAKDGVSKCPEHGTMISRESIKMDKAAAKEIKSLLVNCPNYIDNLCEEKISLENLKNHLQTCSEDTVTCPANCGRKMKKDQLEKHQHLECPKNTKRILSSMDAIKFEFGINDKGRNFTNNAEERNSYMKPSMQESRLQIQLLQDTMFALEMRMDRIMMVIRDEFSQIQDSFRSLRLNLSKRIEVMEIDIEHSRLKINAMNKTIEELNSSVSTLMKEKQLVNKQISSLPKHAPVLPNNGIFLWKINNYSQLKQETALHRKDISSSPFYTDSYGYKMCLAVDLNGDGAGKGTHLSVYACIMKGKYDDILCWPFQQRITFMLMDQRASREKNHIQQTLSPDPQWPEFQKPTNGQSPGRGFHKFVKLVIIEKDDTYLRDDAIYIKVLVDDSIVL